MNKDRIVAVCLVTQSELEGLGSTFSRAYPIDESPRFAELLRAIDEADSGSRSPVSGSVEQGAR